MTVLLGVLLVLEMATFLGKSDKVGEDHATKADMVERVNRAGLDVLGMVVVQTSLHRLLRVVDREHRLHVFGQFLHLHALDFVVDVPPRHFPAIAEIERSMPVFDPNGVNEKT